MEEKPRSWLAELARLEPSTPVMGTESLPSETDAEWLARLTRRAARITQWAMEQDKQEVAERYAWMLLLALEMRKSARSKDGLLKEKDMFARLERYRADAYLVALRGAAASVLKARRNASDRNRMAADSRHSRPGGSRDKAKRIRDIWASGKYTSRDRCAEEECGTLGLSFSTARKALRNTSDPT